MHVGVLRVCSWKGYNDRPRLAVVRSYGSGRESYTENGLLSMKSSIAPLFVSFGVLLVATFARPTEPETAPVNFGRDVMPIIGQRCFKCHGPDTAKAAAGLRLDSSAFAARVIVAGSPSHSKLIERVSASDAQLRMPPADSGVKPLNIAEIQTLRNWIKQGARYEKHWSFVAPSMPPIPAVHDMKWPKSPVDRFVLAKLESVGMTPEPEADRDTLALRASQTLTGLPPSLDELNAFRRDSKPGAYERYVDRLLAKPSYGEHAARYWLDAVRYADTHGLQLDNERGVFPYRDWVVRAFNADLPYNKFVEWQLAGDLLAKPTTEQLIATGFVRMNLTSSEGGAIEDEFLARNTFDRVDTASTVLLGLTVQCAKCHDHKYDPIRQSDYYGLYAFFNSTTDRPLDGNAKLPEPVVRAATPEQESHLASLARSMQLIEDSVQIEVAKLYFSAKSTEVPATLGWEKSPVYVRKSFDEAFDSVEAAEPGRSDTVTWRPLRLESGKDLPNLIGKDNASVYVRGTVRFEKDTKFSFGVSSDDGVKVWLNGTLIHSHKITRGLSDGTDMVTGNFKAGNNELVLKVTNGGAPDGLNLRLYDANDKRIHDVLDGIEKRPRDPSAIRQLKLAYFELGPETAETKRYRELRDERGKLEASIPMSLIAREMPKPRATFILKRGQYDQRGDPVTRHIPAALGTLPKGTRFDRLGLAQWLTSRENPLVSRVFVNRIWQQHFGIGLVKTAEDFGTQGEWPMNQNLLDYLAVSFREGGWSVKKLNRMIVTSAAFRQSSRITPKKLAKDPENRWVSRGPRFRLDAEVIRDKALFSGGLLLDQIGGRGFKPYQPDGIWEATSDPASQTHFYVRDRDKNIYRRSMYLFWKRTAPPPSMLSFDAPLRDTCVVRRSTTNTPLQALTSENEPAFLESARLMAQRILTMSSDDSTRLRIAFNLALARPARTAEIEVLTRALAKYRDTYRQRTDSARKLLAVGDAPQSKSIPVTEQAAWMLVCSTLMNTDEFLTLH